MEIVRLPTYLKDIRRIGLTVAEQTALERGGGRAIYLVLFEDDRALLLRAYAKNVQGDLSAADRKALLSLLEGMGL